MKVLWVQSHTRRVESSTPVLGPMLEAVKSIDIGIDIFPVGRASFGEFQRKISALKRLATGYDVIHSQYGSFCQLVVSAVDHPAKVLTLRGSDWHTLKRGPWREATHSKMATWVTRRRLSKFSCLSAVSYRLCKEVGEYTEGREVNYLPTPLRRSDIQRCVEQVFGTPRRRQPYGVLSSFAAGSTNKGVAQVREIEHVVRRTFPSFRIRILTGMSQSKVLSEIAGASVVLVLSQHEGWPNIVKEGVSFGVPFVTTDVGDLRAYAEETGTGEIGEANPEAFGKLIVKRIMNPGVNNCQEALADFTPDLFAQRLQKLYGR